METRKEFAREMVHLLARSFRQDFLKLYSETRTSNKVPRLILREYQAAIKHAALEKTPLVQRTPGAEALAYRIARLHAHLTGNKVHAEDVLQSCMLEVSREVWRRPFLFYHGTSKMDQQQNLAEFDKLVKVAIKSVVYAYLPLVPFVEALGDEYEGEGESASSEDTVTSKDPEPLEPTTRDTASKDPAEPTQALEDPTSKDTDPYGPTTQETASEDPEPTVPSTSEPKDSTQDTTLQEVLEPPQPKEIYIDLEPQQKLTEYLHDREDTTSEDPELTQEDTTSENPQPQEPVHETTVEDTAPQGSTQEEPQQLTQNLCDTTSEDPEPQQATDMPAKEDSDDTSSTSTLEEDELEWDKIREFEEALGDDLDVDINAFGRRPAPLLTILPESVKVIDIQKDAEILQKYLKDNEFF